MKVLKKLGVAVMLSMALALPAVSFNVETKEASAAGTGYTQASDVKYVTSKVGTRSIVANWGARDEKCVFLSKYVDDFYSGNTEYEVMSTLKGGTSQTNIKGTALYNALQTTMATPHTYYTYYEGSKNVRDYYKYTDCVQSDTSKVALLYVGGLVSSTWDNGKTWNQEHMWPKSKLSTDKEIGDIMQLRPENPSENSSRNNTAYGESSGYYNPNKRGQNVRGDCARMALYMHVRYGSSSMWGSGGVIENMNVLLKWMEEDPVDTWEMGRNDAVQSVTGTRNVFVDYPEYAWLLFGKEIPNDMVTPSGIAEEGTVTPPASSEDTSSSEVVKPEDSSSAESSGPDSSEEEVCNHKFGQWIITKQATKTETGERQHTCSLCGTVEKETIPVIESEDPSMSVEPQPDDSDEEEVCEHEFSQWIVTKQPTETEEGEQRRMCMLCGEGESEIIPKLCNHEFSKWIVTKQPTETEDGEQKRVCLLCGEGEKEVIPALGGAGSVEPETSVEDSAEGNSSDNAGGNAIINMAGCSSMAGTSMGGILITLACCVAVDRMRKKKMK